jgi:hypothetical protein
MGVLAPVSAQRDTPLSPPSTSAEIFRCTCLQSSLKKNIKNPGGGGKIFKTKILINFNSNWSERSACASGQHLGGHYWSERVRAPSASFRHDGTTIIIDFFSLFFFCQAQPQQASSSRAKLSFSPNFSTHHPPPPTHPHPDRKSSETAGNSANHAGNSAKQVM